MVSITFKLKSMYVIDDIGLLEYSPYVLIIYFLMKFVVIFNKKEKHRISKAAAYDERTYTAVLPMEKLYYWNFS